MRTGSKGTGVHCDGGLTMPLSRRPCALRRADRGDLHGVEVKTQTRVLMTILNRPFFLRLRVDRAGIGEIEAGINVGGEIELTEGVQ